MLSADTAAFRAAYRRDQIGPHYSGLGHLAFTSFGSLAVVALALSRLDAVRHAELLTVPATFLLANVVEYLGHRGPMHHLTGGLGLLFERHTQQHHRFFTADAMSYEARRDFKMVLFPPVMLLFFLGAIATPIGALLWWAASRNVALFYVATAMGYFLTYEWLHFSHHLPASSRLGRLAPLRLLREHHRLHHDPGWMTRGNFNITFPIADVLFGTRVRDVR